jgi:hypothetical protein
MFSYVAYGLGIRSYLPLPELLDGEAAADVYIRLGNVKSLFSVIDAKEDGFWATSEEAYRFMENVGSFLVRDGREIIVDPVPGVNEQVLRLFILGPILGMLIHQRRLLVLHASTVAVANSAVAFLGESGMGKSTLVASLYTRDHAIVADDLTPVQVDTDSPLVFPGFPRIKLLPDAITFLGNAPEALPLIHPKSEKRAYYVANEFPKAPLPLRCIYVLAEGACQEIEPLNPQDAFIELIHHSYPAVVRLLKAGGTASLHFRQCVTLANCIPICRLKRPRSLSALSSLARFVEDDLTQRI